MNTEEKQMQDNCARSDENIIVCPLCMSMTVYIADDNFCCQVCGREITEDDLNYSPINER